MLSPGGRYEKELLDGVNKEEDDNGAKRDGSWRKQVSYSVRIHNPRPRIKSEGGKRAHIGR
jgi:hypothetical protein